MDFTGFSSSHGGNGGAGEVDKSLYGMLEAEGARYASFFATLEHAAPQQISKATATAFFAKSSLSDAQVEALYASIKSVGVVSDPSVFGETEFVMGMHMIVCMTKRGLATLPSPFPTYLFPSLNLPVVGSAPAARGSFGFASPSSLGAHSDLISSMPSPEKPSGFITDTTVTMSRSSFSSGSSGAVSSVNEAGPPPTELAKVQEASSLIELLTKEAENNRLFHSQLASVDASEAKTLQHLQATLKALAAAVEQLGFPVPTASHASIGALDDYGNLLRASVQSVKQEIQSLEIAAQMRSVADEATSRTNSMSISPSTSITQPSSAIVDISKLTQQLAGLQAEARQLQAKKDALARQVLEKQKLQTPAAPAVSSVVKTVSGSSASFASPALASSGLAASTSWGDFGAADASSAAAVTPLAPPQESLRSTETAAFSTASFSSSSSFAESSSLDASAFGFGSTTAPAPAAASQPQDDFGWGAFQ